MALQIIKNLNSVPSILGHWTTMKAMLAISILFHLIILTAFQKSFPLHWEREELRTYTVELIRPPVEDLDSTGNPSAHMEEALQEEQPVPAEGQDTISLDTKDKRYITYARMIKGEIMQHWRYPPEARAYLMEGSLVVFFSLSRDGNMIQITISKASDHEILDREVVRAVRAAAPFPPFPGSVTVKKLNIKAAFDYRLTSRK